jgi:hypothetical protein
MKTTLLKEWQNYSQQEKQIKRKILNLFIGGKYQYQTEHSAPRKEFKPITYKQIDDIFGLAYTSTGMFAALWICNGVNIWADDKRKFYGFAIGENGNFYAIAEDENEENEVIIEM